MQRDLMLAACFVAMAFVALACNGGDSEAPPATQTPGASPTPSLSALPGFAIKLSPETRNAVSIGDVPAVFEEYPNVVAAEPSQTSEGQVSSPVTICRGSMLVRDVVVRLIGNWVSFAILDDEGECVATRQGYPRDGTRASGPGQPAAIALEATSAGWAGTASIVGSTESFTFMGITYYPPELVEVRGVNGVYLREEGTGSSEALPVHRLIWIEDGIYWHLIGMDEQATGDPGLYNLEGLLAVAETLREVTSD